MGSLQLLEASELPGHVVEPGLRRPRGLIGGQLEQRELVMLLSEAQEYRAGGVVGDLEPEGARVEVLGPLRIANLQHHVAELAGLDHVRAPSFALLAEPSIAARGAPSPCSRRRPRAGGAPPAPGTCGARNA